MEQEATQKIDVVEKTPLFLLAGAADFAEFGATLVAGFVPIGTIIWFLAAAMGLFVSGILIFWAFFRGYGVSRRAAVMAIGAAVDVLTGTFLPIRTLTLWLTIALHNRYEDKRLEKLVAAFERVT